MTVEVIQLSLLDLAEEANREYALAYEARDDAVRHALACGAALLDAKAQVGHGNWLPWVAENFDGSEDTAERFMRLAANSARVRNLDPPSIRAGLRALGAGTDLDPLMSSTTAEWSTPDDLFKLLNDEFSFDLDVCATSGNAKCPLYFTEDDDGLAQDWRGVCWMNPPYGRVIGHWMAKAHAAADAGATVVCLVPARTDTDWFWEHARHGEIRFLHGRLKFGCAMSAPFPSCVVIFGRPPKVVWWER